MFLFPWAQKWQDLCGLRLCLGVGAMGWAPPAPNFSLGRRIFLSAPSCLVLQVGWRLGKAELPVALPGSPMGCPCWGRRLVPLRAGLVFGALG